MQDEIVIENGKMIKKRFQFYERLRKKFSKFSRAKLGEDKGKITEFLFTIPDFFMLLLRLSLEKRVANKQKLLIGGIIAYVISPIDIIPDFVPLFGYVDDLVLIVYGLNIVLNEIDLNIIKDNWSGEEDVLELIRRITAVSEEFLDKNLLKKIRNILNKIRK